MFRVDCAKCGCKLGLNGYSTFIVKCNDPKTLEEFCSRECADTYIIEHDLKFKESEL